MTKLKVSLLALAAVLATSAPAPSADRYAPVQPFSWSGFYIGGSVGYLNGHGVTSDLDDYDYSRDMLTNADSAHVSANIGYNMQMANLVLGIEGDIGWANAKGLNEYYGLLYYDPCGTDGENYCTRNEIGAVATVRGRLGYAWDRALFYGTGGVAYGKVHNYWEYDENGPDDGDSVTDSAWKTGWVAGAGLEYAVTDRVTVKAEGLYYDFGSTQKITNNDYPGYRIKFQNTATTARMGVNFKF